MTETREELVGEVSIAKRQLVKPAGLLLYSPNNASLLCVNYLLNVWSLNMFKAAAKLPSTFTNLARF